MMKKEEFIQKLRSISSDDINKIIEENGKKPKLIKPVYFIKGGEQYERTEIGFVNQ